MFLTVCMYIISAVWKDDVSRCCFLFFASAKEHAPFADKVRRSFTDLHTRVGKELLGSTEAVSPASTGALHLGGGREPSGDGSQNGHDESDHGM